MKAQDLSPMFKVLSELAKAFPGWKAEDVNVTNRICVSFCRERHKEYNYVSVEISKKKIEFDIYGMPNWSISTANLDLKAIKDKVSKTLRERERLGIE